MAIVQAYLDRDVRHSTDQDPSLSIILDAASVSDAVSSVATAASANASGKRSAIDSMSLSSLSASMWVLAATRSQCRRLMNAGRFSSATF